MVSRLSCWVGAAALGMLLTPPLAAGDDGPQEVRLYTNADLRQFGDPEPAPVDTSSEERSDREREIVIDFLDREYARIQAEQQMAVLRSSAQPPETESPDSYGGFGPYVLGGYGGYYGGYYGDGRFGNKAGRGYYYRLPSYDLRTARHGYFVPAQRYAHGRSRAFIDGAGAGRMTRPLPRDGGGPRGHSHR